MAWAAGEGHVCESAETPCPAPDVPAELQPCPPCAIGTISMANDEADGWEAVGKAFARAIVAGPSVRTREAVGA